MDKKVKKTIENLGRAGPVKFWAPEKIRFFDPVTPGRNPVTHGPGWKGSDGPWPKGWPGSRQPVTLAPAKRLAG